MTDASPRIIKSAAANNDNDEFVAAGNAADAAAVELDAALKEIG